MGLPEFEMPRGSTRNILIAAAGAVALLAVFLYLWGGGTPPTTTGPDHRDGSGGDNLKDAVDSLRKDKLDLNTCRAALNRINSEEARKSKSHPANLDEKDQQQWQQQVEQAQKLFNLDTAQVTEIEARSYTLLDAHHLDQCFLLHDAARALEGDPPAQRAPLERARDAFDWVVRQVRLQDYHNLPVPVQFAARPLPPQFALRRGWGSPLDRALIFLALLEQLPDAHLTGCLLAWPKSGELPELWACGVVVENDPSVYLFDPRLGLPLPGAKGADSIATLAEARNNPAVLEQLTVNAQQVSFGAVLGSSYGVSAGRLAGHAKYPYDVTAQRAREAEIYQCCSLSALAPRLAFLQNKLLAPADVPVRLAVDAAADRQKLEAAAKTLGDKPAAVKTFPTGLDVLRSFLPKEQGGLDEGVYNGATQVELFSLDLVPWNELPPPFNNQNAFPVNTGLGQRVRQVFAAPFLRFAQEPEQARDLMLRGDYRHAVELLSQDRQGSLDQLREATKMVQNDPQWEQKLFEWIKRAQEVYAKFNQDKTDPAKQKAVEDIWRDPGAQVVATTLNGAVAYPRGEQATYYLALCKHELAEQAQRWSNRPAKEEWGDALYWWDNFDDNYRAAPEAEAARRLHGQALALLGQRDRAIQVWEGEVKNAKHPLEATACLYLAAQLRKK